MHEKEVVEDMGKVYGLKKNEQKGLDSLQKRIKNGEITVLETDKTSKFTVMSQSLQQPTDPQNIENTPQIAEQVGFWTSPGTSHN